MDKSLLIKTVQEAQSGSETAQQALYSEFAKTVYYISLKMVKHHEDAEDIMQSVFISVLERLGELEDVEAFPAWLKRITTNKCTDFLRKRKEPLDVDIADLDGVSDFFEETDPLLIPEKSVENAEVSQIILEVIDNLPLPQRVCIYYYYYEQMTVAQIAENLATSEGTVKSRLSLARAKIREALEKKEKEEGIKLYAMPLLITPILRVAFQQFEMPSGVIESTWSSIASAQATATTATATITATSAVAETTGGIVMALKTKILLAVAGVAVVGGITTGALVWVNNNENAKRMEVIRNLQEQIEQFEQQTADVSVSDLPEPQTTVVENTEIIGVDEEPEETEPPEPIRRAVSRDEIAEIKVYLQDIGFSRRLPYYNMERAEGFYWQHQYMFLDEEFVNMPYFNDINELSLNFILGNYFSANSISNELLSTDSRVTVTLADIEKTIKENVNPTFSIEGYDYRQDIMLITTGLLSYQFEWLNAKQAWEVSWVGGGGSSGEEIVIEDYTDVYRIGDIYYYVGIDWRLGKDSFGFIDIYIEDPNYTIYELKKNDNGNWNIYSMQPFTGELPEWVTAATAFIEAVRDAEESDRRIDKIAFLDFTQDGIKDVCTYPLMYMYPAGVSEEINLSSEKIDIFNTINSTRTGAERRELYRDKTTGEYVGMVSRSVRDEYFETRIEYLNDPNHTIIHSSSNEWYLDEATQLYEAKTSIVIWVNNIQITEEEFNNIYPNFWDNYEPTEIEWYQLDVNFNYISGYEDHNFLSNYFHQLWEIFKAHY